MSNGHDSTVPITVNPGNSGDDSGEHLPPDVLQRVREIGIEHFCLDDREQVDELVKADYMPGPEAIRRGLAEAQSLWSKDEYERRARVRPWEQKEQNNTVALGEPLTVLEARVLRLVDRGRTQRQITTITGIGLWRLQKIIKRIEGKVGPIDVAKWKPRFAIRDRSVVVLVRRA